MIVYIDIDECDSLHPCNFAIPHVLTHLVYMYSGYTGDGFSCQSNASVKCNVHEFQISMSVVPAFATSMPHVPTPMVPIPASATQDSQEMDYLVEVMILLQLQISRNKFCFLELFHPYLHKN